jgi:hypothetical protein
MSTRTRKRIVLFPLVLILLAATASLAPSASAAGTAVGTIGPSSVPAGTTTPDTTFTIASTSGQIGSFNLTAPAGWVLSSLIPSAGVTLVSSTLIQGRNLSVGSTPLTIHFSAQAPCAPSSSSFTLVAKSGPNFNGSNFAVDATGLAVTLTGTCTATFVTAPADAAFNLGTKSENITGVSYDPTGAAVQVVVKDANGTARAGIEITLLLSGGTSGATLSGPVVMTSDGNGLATFTSTTSSLSISKTGLNYVMTPTGSGISGASSGTFSIFQEGDSCISGQSCEVHGTSTKIKATISATAGGNLGGSVEPITVVAFAACEGANPLSDAVIVWKYTAQGAQTVAAVVDKSLLRTNKGSAHIEVCFEVDAGKDPFINKFGQTVTKGLLPDCGPGISTNCINSETGLNGGSRLIVFTVEDGKGRI